MREGRALLSHVTDPSPSFRYLVTIVLGSFHARREALPQVRSTAFSVVFLVGRCVCLPLQGGFPSLSTKCYAYISCNCRHGAPASWQC